VGGREKERVERLFDKTRSTPERAYLEEDMGLGKGSSLCKAKSAREIADKWKSWFHPRI